MKKLVAALATTSVIFTVTATAATNVSAEDYEVQQEDTLWGIANEFHTSVENLLDLNELESTVIHPGDQIMTEKSDRADKEEIYIVEKGDTLTAIAGEYDVTVDNIMDRNELSTTLINIGQELKIQSQEENSELSIEENESSNEAVQNEEVAAEATENDEAEAPAQPAGKTISVKATAYTATCEGCSGVTSTGIDLNANPDQKVIAVDPNVIPLGSEVHVEGYGNAIAGDIGGAIKGDRIDVFIPTKGEANSWGVRNVDVTILD